MTKDEAKVDVKELKPEVSAPKFPAAPSLYDIEQQRLARWRAGQGVEVARPEAPQPVFFSGDVSTAEGRLARWQAQYKMQEARERRNA